MAFPALMFVTLYFLLPFCQRRDGKSLGRFLEDYFANRLKRYIKSEPVPETNDGPVKVCKQ